MPAYPDPLNPLKKNQTPSEPRTVLSAQPVELVLITYADESNQLVTQFGVVGEKNVHLLESRSLGVSRNSTPQGQASRHDRHPVHRKLL